MGNIVNGDFKVFPLASEDLSPPPPPHQSNHSMNGYSGYDDDSLVVRTDGMKPGDQVYNYEQSDSVLDQVIRDVVNSSGFFDDSNQGMDGMDLKILSNHQVRLDEENSNSIVGQYLQWLSSTGENFDVIEKTKSEEVEETPASKAQSENYDILDKQKTAADEGQVTQGDENYSDWSGSEFTDSDEMSDVEYDDWSSEADHDRSHHRHSRYESDDDVTSLYSNSEDDIMSYQSHWSVSDASYSETVSSSASSFDDSSSAFDSEFNSSFESDSSNSMLEEDTTYRPPVVQHFKTQPRVNIPPEADKRGNEKLQKYLQAPVIEHDHDHHHTHAPAMPDKNGIVEDVLGVDHGLGFGGFMGMSDLMAIGEHWARKEREASRSHGHRHDSGNRDYEDIVKLRDLAQFIKFLSEDSSRTGYQNSHFNPYQ